MSATSTAPPLGFPPSTGLARRLGSFDATMIVMGGIVGSGIFVTPAVVAQQVHTPLLIIGAWVAGGLVALAGAFIWAELAQQRPQVGGQYAYLRDAYHPTVAFLYGWALLLVVQTGGMAAVAITFARYFAELTRIPVRDSLIAAAALTGLVVVNCMGVRSGSSVQNALMVMKILAIAVLILAGLVLVGVAESEPAQSQAETRAQAGSLTAFGAALIPVMFSYGGWQTASFVAGEMRDPRRDLARGLLIGVLGVILLYLGVSVACVRALGAAGLAQSAAPASSVMRIAFGEAGAKLIAAGIAVSTLGFLSQGMLTAPRVYFSMAEDRLFFRRVAWVHPGTRAPVTAIVLQGLLALLIALTGTFAQILNYVVSVDFIFFGLTAGAVFVFRRQNTAPVAWKVPGHPVTTGFFILACALVVLSTITKYPANSAIGLAILAAGIPVYLYWRRRQG